MLFTNGNDFDISSVWGSSKKIPVWIKYGERRKVKEQNLNIVYGKEGLFLGRGLDFRGKGGWISCR